MESELRDQTLDVFRLIVKKGIEVYHRELDSHKWLRHREKVNISDSGGVSWREIFKPDDSWARYVALEIIKSGSEYEQFKAVVSLDPTFSGQIDVMIGSAHGMKRITHEEVLRTLLGLYLTKSQESLDYDESVFLATCSEIHDAFSSDVVVLRSYSILHCFRMGNFTVHLEPGVSLQGMSPQEVQELWNDNQMVQQLFPLWGLLGSKVTDISARLVSRTNIQKLVSNSAEDILSSQPRIDIRNTFELVVTALRLLKPGPVRLGPIFESSSFPWDWLSATMSGSMVATLPSAPYVLDESESDSLRELFVRLRKSQSMGNRALTTGLNRISYACERLSEEDKLLDAMIALEALVLSGLGNAKERGEMRWRLSICVAKLLSDNPHDAELYFDLVREAYDLRSKVVHGDTLSAEERQRVTDILNLACRVGRTLLQMSVDGNQPDWKKLVLGVFNASN